MDSTNTTVFSLEILSSCGKKSFRPIIRIADNGIWDIADHEDLALYLGEDGFNTWIEDFFHEIRKEKINNRSTL